MSGDGDAPSHMSRLHTAQYGSPESPNAKCTSSGIDSVTIAGRHPSSTSSNSSSFSPGSSTMNLQSFAPSSCLAQPDPVTALTSTRNSLLLLSHSRSPSSLSDRTNGDVAWSGRVVPARDNSLTAPGPKSRVSAYFRSSNGLSKGRQLFVMRHAERVDICFGRGWVTRYFDKRVLIAESDLLVRIEPHLFEWFGWYGNCAPRMMNPQDLRACGYQVDVNYRPLSSSTDFDPEETISNYYDRTGGLTKRLLSQHKSKDACILIVAHASSLDTCTHQLVHHGFRTCISSAEFHHRTSGVPYCGLVVAQENRRWTLVNPPIPNVCSYTPNPDFDWRQLLSPTLCGFAIK
ncbi:unnamed protein product [Echinostoma caproni]|uniref:Uncharacterized protein n=1 Tax=Echinostoma caproni TaxID=27848 RepID=A0A183A8P0_9TREM|nr:unnamed protein product [Echinostoma caproni]